MKSISTIRLASEWDPYYDHPMEVEIQIYQVKKQQGQLRQMVLEVCQNEQECAFPPELSILVYEYFGWTLLEFDMQVANAYYHLYQNWKFPKLTIATHWVNYGVEENHEFISCLEAIRWNYARVHFRQIQVIIQEHATRQSFAFKLRTRAYNDGMNLWIPCRVRIDKEMPEATVVEIDAKTLESRFNVFLFSIFCVSYPATSKRTLSSDAEMRTPMDSYLDVPLRLCLCCIDCAHGLRFRRLGEFNSHVLKIPLPSRHWDEFSPSLKLSFKDF